MKLLITAGPTREPIDAVRFISNRSSGKLGLALAETAAAAGHRVTLLLGPGPTAPPLAPPHHVFRFNSSAELKQLMEAHLADCDVLIMAAAVADYRPAQVLEGKLPRDPDAPLVLQLQPVPDLVALMAQQRRPEQKIIAFALEENEHLVERARSKLARKRVDAIVANPLGTMESDGITPTWITPNAQLSPGRMSKTQFASWLLDRVAELCNDPTK